MVYRQTSRKRTVRKRNHPHRSLQPLKKSGSTPFMFRIKPHCYGDQSGKCNGCGQNSISSFYSGSYHALARGGSNDLENLQLLCYYCNNLKSDKSHEFLIKRLKEEGFDLRWSKPLAEVWGACGVCGFFFCGYSFDAGAAVRCFQ